ncbi:anion transporter [Tepidicella baoligensis]|uniref:anion transporter n=1 Tax=Tepidicella baoligensis TaxID=2707016 RepID=UPI0015D9DA2E|nr:anion transporter [Tepidicella baoligensis]
MSHVEWGVLLVFLLVYLGMFLGGLPRLKLDRSGVALLGAIAVIALTGMPIETAAQAVDLPTLVLLFAFMLISAQMRLGGFYTEVTRRVAARPLSAPALLAALIAVAGALSAVFSNDVVCLAMTPVVVQLCLQRGRNPLPFLIGLACASNIGSAATLIGNPQNMLIGSVLSIPFGAYLWQALPPVLLSLIILWLWLFVFHLRRDGWKAPSMPAGDAPLVPQDAPPYNPWQTTKGLVVAGSLMAIFLFTDWPHEVAALVGAGVLLLSRRLHSAHVIGLVDWSLLLLFIGLFVVNAAMQQTGMAGEAVRWLGEHGIVLTDPGVLLVLGTALSNLVSNVPAVMLLLPHLGTEPGQAGVMLALVSTFAGNLLLVGSIANLIVADLAARQGVRIDWRQHAAVGLPVTLLTLAVVWAFMG